MKAVVAPSKREEMRELVADWLALDIWKRSRICLAFGLELDPDVPFDEAVMREIGKHGLERELAAMVKDQKEWACPDHFVVQSVEQNGNVYHVKVKHRS
jgi:hypothetical protein